ncbi:MAG: DUF1214 domain-containing protein [Pseudomonadales bacterium]
MSDEKNAAREVSIARVMDGRSWDDFCDALKKAGRDVVLSDSAPNNPLDRAEGWRYLARLTRGALESFLEAADTQAPAFTRGVHETIKMGMDNPDNIYLTAPVNGNYTYRITGTRGSVHYLGFGAQAGGYGKTASLDTSGYLEAKDMHIHADGSFEIIASSTPQQGNWLKMSPETRLIQVRQTRIHHKTEIPAQVSIERIDGDNQPRHLSAERVDKALQGAGFFVAGTASLFAKWAEDFRQNPNTLPRFNPDVALAAGGDPNIAYYHGYFQLQDDEALEITFTPPACDFWNLQLGNYWLESLDYRYFPVHINKGTAHYNEDGSVRLVISKQKIAVKNWLDTCGRNEGTMCLRWIRAAEHPQPQVRVVKISELKGQ